MKGIGGFFRNLIAQLSAGLAHRPQVRKIIFKKFNMPQYLIRIRHAVKTRHSLVLKQIPEFAVHHAALRHNHGSPPQQVRVQN